MTFGVTAIVPNPTKRLVRALKREDFSCGVTEKNYLWVHLPQDLVATCQAYPDEWKQSEDSDRWEREQLGVYHTLYEIPEPILNRKINPRFHVEATEVSYSNVARIVADGNGDPLKPFMIEGEATSRQPWTHPTTAYFGGESLSTLTLYCGKNDEGVPYGSLILSRAEVSRLPRQVLVTEENILNLSDAALASRRLSLKDDHGKWDPMLKELYSRRECNDKQCRGHFVRE